jgi:DNA-binding transcriptional regulator PaaX
MNLREARREGLVSISYHTSRKEDAKTKISELRKKYKDKDVRVILVTEPYSRGYDRYNSYYVFGNDVCAALVNKEIIEKEVSMFDLKFQALEDKYKEEREKLSNKLNELNEDIKKYTTIIENYQNKDVDSSEE